jgi:glucose dehydrogenase
MTTQSKTVLSAVMVAAATTLRAQSITSNDLLDGLSNTLRWLIYSGDYSGQRFSPLAQITPANARQLAAEHTDALMQGTTFRSFPPAGPEGPA